MVEYLVSAFPVVCHGVSELIYYIRRLACMEGIIVACHEEHSINELLRAFLSKPDDVLPGLLDTPDLLPG